MSYYEDTNRSSSDIITEMKFSRNIWSISGDFFHSTIYKNFHERLLSSNINSIMLVPNKESEICPRGVIILDHFSIIDKLLFMPKQIKVYRQIKKMKLQKPDWIHSHFLFSGGLIAYWLSKYYKIPFSVSVRNTDINFYLKKFFFLKWLGIFILKKANSIVFINPAYKKEVFNNYFSTKIQYKLDKKVRIIPNGIDKFWLENLYTHKRTINGQVNIIQVGEINKNKNIIGSIKAIELLIENGYNIKFNLAGNISDKDIYETIKKYNFVNYLGYLNKEQLISQYRDNHIFLLPSFLETFGLVYAEALSQGLPIVYSSNQGFDGQIKEYVVGYGVNPYSPTDIKNKLEKIIKEYDNVSKYTVDAVLIFDWKRIVNEYLNIFSNLK